MLSDEFMDEMGANLDAQREGRGCEHDWDLGAGQTQVMHNGAFEILDVCVRCGAERHTGTYDSVL